MTTYTYGFNDGTGGNEHGDLLSVSYNDGTTPTTTFSYDRRGQQTGIVRNGMTTTRQYHDSGIPLGEMQEQRVIVAAVERECAPLNTAIARTEREIALMQEYRTRLTADVVTGKLDVRPAAAKLPALPAASATPDPAADEGQEELEPEEAE